MAAARRKVNAADSDSEGSLARAPGERFENNCDACLTEGRHIEANRYCLNCREYLCKECVRYHKKTKALWHHKILDTDNKKDGTTLSSSLEVCTEKCLIHRNEIIMFFCSKHEHVGCIDCITQNHGSCKTDFIPDICNGLEESETYTEVMESLDLKLDETVEVVKIATEKDEEVDDSYNAAITDIGTFRKDVNEKLDKLQETTEKAASDERTAEKKDVQAVLASCNNFASDIKELQSSLEKCKAKHENVKLFINITKAKSILQSETPQQAGESLQKTKTKFIFQRNKDLENMLTADRFGLFTIVSSQPAPAQLKTEAFITLSYKEDLNVITETDDETCDITACVFLPRNKLVLSDCNNSKLKVLDIDKNTIIEEQKLDSSPHDIALLPASQIAVTFPDKRKILFMKTDEKITIDRKVKLERRCKGIAYHQACLYIVCQNPSSILILDMKGNAQKVISLAESNFTCPTYITVSPDQKLVYISDYDTHSVACVTPEGDVSAVYSGPELCHPMGLMLLDNGSIIICADTISLFSADLTPLRKRKVDKYRPQSICYSEDRNEVYISGEGCNHFKVFSLCM